MRFRKSSSGSGWVQKFWSSDDPHNKNSMYTNWGPGWPLNILLNIVMDFRNYTTSLLAEIFVWTRFIIYMYLI